MKATDRFLLMIYLLILTAVFVFAAIIPFGYISANLVETILYGLKTEWYVSAILVVLVLVNLRFIIALVKGDRPQRFGVIKLTSAGEINISNETIRSLVLKTTGTFKGIRDTRVMVRPGKDKINIYIKLLILPDVNIPQTVKEIQESVKGYIESIAEIPVGEVRVQVMDVAAGTKLRVE